MTILILCREEELVRELVFYVQAFRRRGIHVVESLEGFPLNGELGLLIQRCPERPFLILCPEVGRPLLPWGLTEVDVPTACFQIDTYAYTSHRIHCSMLFDHAFVFHPGFDEKFRQAGYSCAHLLPHAAEPSLFSREELDRIFEVGWVGQTRGPSYRARQRLLPRLSRSFRMNDLNRSYSQAEMARIYCQSRIVVNIGRDDYPQDANLRVFEVMAAGALLITSLPSELTQIGFEEGVHFVGYREVEEVQPLIRKYLAEELARRRIAEAAREKVMREHTYDRRVEYLLGQIERCRKKGLAPARAWSEERVRLTYLDYFAANNELNCAAKELRRIAQLSFKETTLGAVLMMRAWARKIRNYMQAQFIRS